MKRYKYSVEEIKRLTKSMIILVDSREKKNSHILDYFRKQKIAYQVEKLEYGDYSFMIPAAAAGEDIYFHRDCVVERKASLEELSGNLTGERERFEKEFLKAGNDGCKVYLMVEAPGGYSDIIGHNYASERFERPIRKSYRISVHESYRENGKVKKKQTVICTVGYYDIVDWGGWIGDFITGGLKAKADILGLTEDALYELIYGKWQPIVNRVLAEFQQTEEYKRKEENRRILNEHNQRVDAFREKYGVDGEYYSRCYDVFGKLRNPEYLKKIKADFKAKKEYERRSREQSRSYYENFYGNYGGYNSGSYCGTVASNYNEADKAMLKKFYRTLSKAFHPDSNPGVDTSEEMNLLNRLKSDWGV